MKDDASDAPKVVPGASDDEPRQIQLVLRRIDPWTVLKQSFLLSVIFGLAMVLTTVILWFLLDALHVWSSIQQAMGTIDSSGPAAELLSYLQLPRVTAMATVFAVINTVLLTVVLTIGSLLYNLSAQLVGGLRFTLTDE